jgi:hypothetical protein
MYSTLNSIHHISEHMQILCVVQMPREQNAPSSGSSTRLLLPHYKKMPLATLFLNHEQRAYHCRNTSCRHVAQLLKSDVFHPLLLHMFLVDLRKQKYCT